MSALRVNDRPLAASLGNEADLADRLVIEQHRLVRREKRKVLFLQVMLVAVAIAVWELLVRIGVLREFWIGEPGKIATFIVRTIQDGTLLRDTWITTEETILGILGGFILGAIAGLLIWWSRTLENVLDPLMVALNSLPKIALTPIFLLWFGVGVAMKVALTFSTVFLVAFLTAAASLRALDRELLDLTAALGGSRWQVFRNVVVPSSMPWLFSAMKLSIGFGLTGAVVGEFVAANAGIGYLLLYGAQIYEMSLVWAGIAALLVIAILMYWAVAVLERKILHWRDN
jgi:NitT/TauT family transport system permease protein